MDYPVKTPRQLGQILRGQRKSRGLTQDAAATRVGLLPKTISKIEDDPSSSTVASLFKLLAALDMEITVRDRTPVSDTFPDQW